MKRHGITLFALVATLLVGNMAQAADEKKGPAANVGGVEDKAGGSVTGVVKFTGAQMARKPVNMAGNPFCAAALKGKFPEHKRWIYGKNGKDVTLGNVLVYVSKGLEGKKFPVPKTPVILDQKDCVYNPHVVAVRTGQQLKILNSDNTLHNVFCAPTNNKAFNDGMPVKGMELDKVFSKGELKVNLKCAVHPWMSAYVHVVDHPFFALSSPTDGSFTINGLPAGEYELSVMHEVQLASGRGFQPAKASISVKVGGGEKKAVDFSYTIVKKK